MSSIQSDIIKVKLDDGYEVTINEKRLKNMRLIDAMRELEKDFSAISDVCLLMFGKDERDKLYAHVEDEDGIVNMEDISTALEQIFASAKVKN